MRPCCLASLLLVSVVGAALGLGLLLAFPPLLQRGLGSLFVLSADSPNLDKFVNPTVDFYHNIYFFNVTNAEDILAGATPHVVEVGPFSFKEKKRKENVQWNDLDFTVAYEERSTFHYLGKNTDQYSWEEPITTINPVYLTLGSLLQDPDIPEIAHAGLEVLALRTDSEPFITKPVRQLLYEGYDDDLILALSRVTQDPKHKTGKFGFFYPKNHTITHKFNESTGADDINKLHDIVEIDGLSELDIWSTEHCNRIEGRAGAPFPQPIRRYIELKMYSEGMCRSIQFEYKKDVSIDKISMYRFGLPDSLLAKSEENACYCTDDFACRNQMAYLAPCKDKAPMVASYPHFYLADQEDIDAISGLKPDADIHETYIDIEPTSGLSLRVRKRVQVNMALKRYVSLPSLANIKEQIFPIFWIDNTVDVPQESLDILYTKAILSQSIVFYLGICWIVIGTLSAVATLIVYFHDRTKNSKTETEPVKVTMTDTSTLSNGNSRGPPSHREAVELHAAAKPADYYGSEHAAEPFLQR